MIFIVVIEVLKKGRKAISMSKEILKTYSVKEAANLLGYSYGRVYEWIKEIGIEGEGKLRLTAVDIYRLSMKFGTKRPDVQDLLKEIYRLCCKEEMEKMPDNKHLFLKRERDHYDEMNRVTYCSKCNNKDIYGDMFMEGGLVVCYDCYLAT